jgi:hypothetical protein
MGLRVEQAQPDMDAFELYDDMREEDMMECIGLMHHPKDAVNISFQNSIKCYSLRDNDGLYCSFGVVPNDNVGVVWLLGTRRLEGAKKYFVKNSQKWVDEMMHGFDYLTNVVMKTNTLSMRWLKWLGAEFNDCQYDGYMSFILERK